ncbi:hypothetical protein AUF62_02840 [archaeon 13_1_20CM_52_20]|nr:MAG: hypothetical protein AUF62_02840 [archaeon 13_1_20CM_52_20]
MSISSKQLVDFLDEVGKTLDRKIVLVAAGGTALTLYRAKASTIDVDFTGPAKDVELFQKAVNATQPGFKVHVWPDGQVFSQFLPDDYLRKSKRIRSLKNIDLRALAPADIVVTKTGRLDLRDIDDIEALHQKIQANQEFNSKTWETGRVCGEPRCL